QQRQLRPAQSATEGEGSTVDRIRSGRAKRRRAPGLLRILSRAVPSIEFAGGRGRAFVSLAHFGERFANDENTIKLPAYLKLDAGVEYALSEQWAAQFNVDNLSDEVGLTEGNPRTDVGSSGVGQLYNARPLF